MNIAAPKYELYNSGLALELCALTFGLAALFVLMRKLVMHSDKSDGTFGTAWGCVSIGVAGPIALNHGMQWGLLTAMLCLTIGAAYAGTMLVFYARHREDEDERREREQGKRAIARFNSERVKANNAKRAAGKARRETAAKVAEGQ